MQLTGVIVVKVVGPYNCFLNFANLEGVRKNTVARAADDLRKYADPHTPSAQILGTKKHTPRDDSGTSDSFPET